MARGLSVVNNKQYYFEPVTGVMCKGCIIQSPEYGYVTLGRNGTVISTSSLNDPGMVQAFILQQTAIASGDLNTLENLRNVFDPNGEHNK